MASGKRLPALELPEEESPIVNDDATVTKTHLETPSATAQPTISIPLPPIPPGPRRELMVQLSIKIPLTLVERLEQLTKATGAQKQAVLAAALEAYLKGHRY